MRDRRSLRRTVRRVFVSSFSPLEIHCKSWADMISRRHTVKITLSDETFQQLADGKVNGQKVHFSLLSVHFSPSLTHLSLLPLSRLTLTPSRAGLHVRQAQGHGQQYVLFLPFLLLTSTRQLTRCIPPSQSCSPPSSTPSSRARRRSSELPSLTFPHPSPSRVYSIFPFRTLLSAL